MGAETSRACVVLANTLVEASSHRSQLHAFASSARRFGLVIVAGVPRATMHFPHIATNLLVAD